TGEGSSVCQSDGAGFSDSRSLAGIAGWRLAAGDTRAAGVRAPPLCGATAAGAGAGTAEASSSCQGGPSLKEALSLATGDDCTATEVATGRVADSPAEGGLADGPGAAFLMSGSGGRGSPADLLRGPPRCRAAAAARAAASPPGGDPPGGDPP